MLSYSKTRHSCNPKHCQLSKGHDVTMLSCPITAKQNKPCMAKESDVIIIQVSYTVLEI